MPQEAAPQVILTSRMCDGGGNVSVPTSSLRWARVQFEIIEAAAKNWYSNCRLESIATRDLNPP